MRRWRCGRGAVSIGATCLLLLTGAMAEPARPGAPAPTGTPPASGPPTGMPNALQGFSQNRDEPVHITSRRLEVRDKDKIATFLGDVHVTQGDTNMTCQTLVVFYEQSTATGTATIATQPTAGGQQQVRRLLAQGGVVVNRKDQTATGHEGVFDMKTNTVTLEGDVVVTQCQNVVHGDRLTVDLTTGVSHMESGKSNPRRVEGLFVPGQQSRPADAPCPDPAKPTPAAPAAAAPAAAIPGAATPGAAIPGAAIPGKPH
jgi:lipopolysaccharide export system protein LptA